MIKEQAVIYIAGFTEKKVRDSRKIKSVSPAGDNKIMKISKIINEFSCKVIIINSNAFSNFYKQKLYKRLEVNINKDLLVIYTSLINIKILNFFWSIIQTMKEIKKIKEDYSVKSVLFYNFEIKTSMPAFICKLLYRFNLVAEFEESYVSKLKTYKKGIFKSIVFNFIEKIGIHFVDSAIIVTSNMIQKFNQRKIQYCILRGFIDKDIYQKSKNIKNINAIKKAMYSGRFDDERGVFILLNALKEIDIDLEVYITGYGPMQERVLKEIETIQEKKRKLRIHFKSFLSREEYINLLINSDILINPQKETIEFGKYSFPSKVYDYISAGKLIITSNISDINKIGKDLFVIYNDDNYVELASKIEECVKNYNNYEFVIKNIDRLREKHFELKEERKILKDILKLVN